MLLQKQTPFYLSVHITINSQIVIRKKKTSVLYPIGFSISPLCFAYILQKEGINIWSGRDHLSVLADWNSLWYFARAFHVSGSFYCSNIYKLLRSWYLTFIISSQKCHDMRLSIFSVYRSTCQHHLICNLTQYTLIYFHHLIVKSLLSPIIFPSLVVISQNIVKCPIAVC